MENNNQNDFLENLNKYWNIYKRIECESFERYQIKLNRDLKDKKIEFCDNEKNLDFKLLTDDEKEIYLETFDKNLRMASGIVNKQEYTSNAMFISKLERNELLLLKHLLLNQLKEIDLIFKTKHKINLRDYIAIKIKSNNQGLYILKEDEDDDDETIPFLKEDHVIPIKDSTI